MNSSGIKRGLAATAIAALAVTGIPSIASAETLAQQQGDSTIALRSVVTGGAVSIANDGANNTVSLVATAGAAFDGDGAGAGALVPVEFVSFFYLDTDAPSGTEPTLINTVSRSENGEFQLEWTPPVGVDNVSITAAVTDAEGEPLETTGGVAFQDQPSDTATDVDIEGNAPTVEIAARNGQLGYFTQPGGPAYGNATNNVAGITGTTSDVTNGLDVLASGANASLGIDGGAVTVTGTGSTRAFQGTVNVSASAIDTTDTAPDQILPVLATTDGAVTRDAQGFTVYSQQIAGISATSTPTNPDTGEATVTVTVVDQNGQPVAGANVVGESNGAGTTNNAYTNANGQVTFAGATAGTQSYYVNADTAGATAFNVGFDFRATATVAAATPGSITFSSADGDAFDIDEFDLEGNGQSDLRLRVTDEAGNALVGQRFFGRWTFTPFTQDTDGESSQTTAEFNGVTDANGYIELELPAAGQFPAAAQNQINTLTTAGGTFTLNGYVNRNGSNPGQDPTDLILAPASVKAGESAVEFDAEGPIDRQAGTTQTVTGSVSLADGTTLGGRTLGVTYAPGTNSSLAAAQPAGTTRLSATSATVVTQADGSFSVAVTDPTTTPQASENGTLTAAGTNTVGTGTAAEDGIGVDASDQIVIGFLLNATPSSIVEIDSLEEEILGDATPGRPVEVTIEVRNNENVVLRGQEVTLTTSNGFFTPNDDAASGNTPSGLTADPAPAQGGLVGEYADLGQSMTVVTDANGRARATVAIERDAGFDDDGQVRASITAASGGTSSPVGNIGVTFRSDNAVNPGELRVEVDENQTAGINLPEARVGERVDLNVYAEDQFGNLTEATVNLFDNTANAGFSNDQVTSQYLNDAPVTSASAARDTMQDITARWTQSGAVYNDTSVPTPGFQTGIQTPSVTVEDELETIDWYSVDFARSTFTLTSTADGAVPVGTAVTSTVKVVDQRGNPVQGLEVEFIRQGPAAQDGDPNQERVTNVNGEAFYSFTGTQAGVARISAVVTDGTQNQTIVDNITFQAPTKSAIKPSIQVSNTADGSDKVVISAPKAAGATVDLYKINKNGQARRVKSKALNAQGKRTFIRVDSNGNNVSRFYAIVREGATTLQGRTGTKGIK
ncbi:beta strand repeat-containing protein [Nocardioides marmotae]|uniref:beta strand repeat-containing protein n=1 Tax=Nocardioides marmotae TaxID=2663857 RepID=UPI0012B553A9|nr:Ig-like domain-containing protein [Nocardioides marmotae]MBC9734997.1 Ig-like domain-containing protein [Nocardioides marmotae]MTB86097.1 hypothetical protein [Nocardioides marmotae]